MGVTARTAAMEGNTGMSPRRQTPLVCPICESPLRHVQVQPLGAVTADLTWELHAGQCPEHGWFQAEVVSKPPREIFAVARPGGIARKVLINGRPVYAFPTVWDAMDRRTRVDMYDPRLWAVDWSRLPERGEIVLAAR
jgi:hypothetical protein